MLILDRPIEGPCQEVCCGLAERGGSREGKDREAIPEMDDFVVAQVNPINLVDDA